MFIRKLKDFAEDTRKDGKKTLLERFTQDTTSVSPSFIVENNPEIAKRSHEVYSINPTT